MEISVVKKMGDSSITMNFTGKDEKDAILKATWLLTLPKTCGNCGGEELTLGARSVQDGKYIYVEYQCQSCKYKIQAGEYQNGGLFMKTDWKAPFKPNYSDDLPPNHD